MKLYIGIDLGTTGVKCVLYGGDLAEHRQLYREYPLITLSPSEIEQDAALWWRLTADMLHELCAGVDTAAIGAVGISSQGISVVPVDSSFRPQRNAISWLDRREGTDGGALFRDLPPERYRAITGRPSPQLYAAPKIAWLMGGGCKPYKYLMPLEFLTARLCGVAVTDHSMAAGSGAYDMLGRCWSPEILSALGIDPGLLPAIQNSGTVAGTVTAECARETGLREGTLVAVGAQDQKCGALAAGLSPGVATLSMGTAFALTIKADEPAAPRRGFIPVFSDLFGDGYQLECCINTGGAALKWWRDTLGSGMDYPALNESVERYRPVEGSPFCFPHFSGCGHPRQFENALACFWGISLDTPQEAMLYALMEGLAFSLRENIEAAGQPVSAIRAFGGGSRSPVWLGIIADVCGMPVYPLATAETACMGAAILAMIAAGQDRGACLAAAARSCPAGAAVQPDEDRAGLLRSRYAAFTALEAKLFGG